MGGDIIVALVVVTPWGSTSPTASRHGQRDGDDDRHRRAEAEDRGLDRGDPELRDLGYGDVRTLRGPVAWIDELRRARKRCALVSSSETAESAAERAGIRDRFDAAVSGRRGTRTLARAPAVDVDPAGTTAARGRLREGDRRRRPAGAARLVR
jgi:beta-phosphoglucomutase-like phosphatase (HAD superfamily)